MEREQISKIAELKKKVPCYLVPIICRAMDEKKVEKKKISIYNWQFLTDPDEYHSSTEALSELAKIGSGRNVNSKHLGIVKNNGEYHMNSDAVKYLENSWNAKLS